MSFSSTALPALALIASRLLICDTASLLQRSQSLHSFSAQDYPACTELVNQGLYFTVDIEVGTPLQKFSVVADTGSNTLIVPSCLCSEHGSCSISDRCFTGKGRSSTFSIINGSDGRPEGRLLHFGSGEITGVLARDVVRIGGLDQYMGDGLMLMTSKALKIASSFEGILGLGIPRAWSHVAKKQAAAVQPSISGHSPAEALRKTARNTTGASFGSSLLTTRMHGALAPPDLALPQDVNSEEVEYREVNDRSFQPGGFLEQAGIARFSMCFNDGTNGVLRLGMPKVPNAHGSVGKMHWALDLRGLSIGMQEVPLSVCSPGGMAEGQQTACAVIPDTGTTIIQAPSEHLVKLFDGLCDGWDRCRQMHANLTAEKEAYGKMQVLGHLLLHCESWLSEGSGLGELPPIHFQVAGTNGTKQTLTLNGDDYVFQTSYEAALGATLLEDSGQGLASISLESIAAVPASADAVGNLKKVCRPSLGAHSYDKSQKPLWILGAPLFYQFNVGFDLSTVPASISFSPTSQTPCGTCDKKAGLVVTGVSPARIRSPRWLDGQPRTSSIDPNSPL